MSLIHARGPARIDANLTPMIDLSFLLIVFFILVARMSGDQLPPISLPHPSHGAMTPASNAPRMALNVVDEGGGPIITLGTRRFGGTENSIEDLAKAIEQRLRVDPATSVDIRADRSLPYAAVEPALRAIAKANGALGGKVRVRVCALADSGGEGG